MMMGMRMRRYRVFLIFAAVFTYLTYHLTRPTDWESLVPIVEELRKESALTHGQDDLVDPNSTLEASPSPKPIPHFPTVKPPELQESASTTSSSAVAQKTPVPADSTTPLEPPKTIPDIPIPDRKPAAYVAPPGKTGNWIRPFNPGRLENPPTFLPTPAPIHWVPQEEHFPVPPEEIIQLPSGKAKSLRKIQYDFGSESAAAKADREHKREKVKEETKRAWAGYRKYAWMHDELTPVTGRSKDPFCGWAATLVDSLDTLWIMGMIPEFEEAVNAVKTIDFTTTARKDIPMFETTIRYLGGLLAAYDLSGAKYKILLDKAVELAEILYSAFDTPNRMPVLYYNWKPTFASQPKRASTRAGTAELGSMAMEFTRLAQLTKEPRYYDAVARVTNALEEFQNKATGLAGVFPSDFDASGCNWTRPDPPTKLKEPVGYQPPSIPSSEEARNVWKPKHPKKLEVQVIPDPAGGPDRATIQGWKEIHGESKNKRDGMEKAIRRRQLDDPSLSVDKPTAPPHKSGGDGHVSQSAALLWTHTEPECTPQGLKAASQQYSMGGGQDSTYEYFPKQYVLLGGLEDKYRTMYLKVIDAVREHMLYRPMIPETDRKLLFSGTVYPENEDGWELDPEVTHLTCFIGGMVGMGAQLFDIKGDLEIAKMLTDGCVWAYESMASGIMAESARIVPCKEANNCAWNETMYNELLDPQYATREYARAEYFRNKEFALKALAEAAQQEADRLAEEAAEVRRISTSSATTSMPTDNVNSKPGQPIQKRSLNRDIENLYPIADNAFAQADFKDSGMTNSPGRKTFGEKLRETEQELEAQNPRGSAHKTHDVPILNERPTKTTNIGDGAQEPLLPVDPLAPLTHQEYVDAKINHSHIPPAYTSIDNKMYILRPEAIESVWYMYRITGDPIWQAKGWRMWEAIMNCTQAEYGNSAIADVTLPADKTKQKDTMESFWIAETLKYFYLLFSEPELVSLDEWVLNTEAHPFRRPV